MDKVWSKDIFWISYLDILFGFVICIGQFLLPKDL